MIFVVRAWVQGSPNIVPIGTLETRSITLAIDTAKLWRKQGWRTELFQKDEKGSGNSQDTKIT